MSIRAKVVTQRLESDKLRAKENHDLRRDIVALKKTNARLRKELARRSEFTPTEEELPLAAVEPTVKVQDAIQCRVCESSHLVRFTTPAGRLIVGCKACGTRQQ